MFKAFDLANAIIIRETDHPLIGVNDVYYCVLCEVARGLGGLGHGFVLNDVFLGQTKV